MTGHNSSTRQSFGWALTGSIAVHAAVLTWGTLEFTPQPPPAQESVIEVKLDAAQSEPAAEEKRPAEPRKLRPPARTRSQPQAQRIAPQLTARDEPAPERAAAQPFTAQNPVETEAPRTAAPAAPAPAQLAVVPETRAREPDYVARYLHNPPPQYPWQARRMGIEGRVVLHVEILQNGGVGRIEIRQSSGHDMLDQAAIKAVPGWRFAPARISGAPITAWVLVPIIFKLKDR
jgi:periplasmic protein TonB